MCTGLLSNLVISKKKYTTPKLHEFIKTPRCRVPPEILALFADDAADNELARDNEGKHHQKAARTTGTALAPPPPTPTRRLRTKTTLPQGSASPQPPTAYPGGRKRALERASSEAGGRSTGQQQGQQIRLAEQDAAVAALEAAGGAAGICRD